MPRSRLTFRIPTVSHTWFHSNLSTHDEPRMKLVSVVATRRHAGIDDAEAYGSRQASGQRLTFCRATGIGRRADVWDLTV